ncbi:MAG: GDSL-type esterase/lipase family protein [Pseudomonadota bacterium]
MRCLARLGLSLCLILTACSEPARFEALPPGSTVLAFGNSVTYGTGAGAGQDYPSQLAQRTGWKVINAGIPGDLARDAGKRLPALLQQHAPDLVIVELGGNDFLRKRPASAVKRELDAILSQVINNEAIPVLVAVPRLSLLRARTGTLKDDGLYQALADEKDIVLVTDAFSDILSEPELRSDPIHPNADGYRRLAGEIAVVLTQQGLLAD